MGATSRASAVSDSLKLDARGKISSRYLLPVHPFHSTLTATADLTQPSLPLAILARAFHPNTIAQHPLLPFFLQRLFHHQQSLRF